MKWAVVTADGHGNHGITGFATKKEAEEFLKNMEHPDFSRTLYRLVPADE